MYLYVCAKDGGPLYLKYEVVDNANQYLLVSHTFLLHAVAIVGIVFTYSEVRSNIRIKSI